MFRKAILILTVLLLSACASTPPTSFYVLEATSKSRCDHQASACKQRSPAKLIGVGPITVPSLLDRKQIITLGSANSVQVAEFHQWASPVKDNVALVLTKNLSALQAPNIIKSYPWSAYGNVNIRLIVDFTRLDTTPGQSVNLESSWAIMDESNHAIVKNGQSKINHPLLDTSYPATVDALSKVLDEFSRELSAALDSL